MFGSAAHNVLQLSQFSYPFLLLVMIVEGPIVSSIAGFAAKLGFLSFWIVYLISVLGDIIGDIIYFSIGRLGRRTFIKKYGSKIGLTPTRLQQFDKAFHTHKFKALTLMKIAPVLPGPGLIATGALNINFLELISISFLISVPKSFIFVLVGYLLGQAYDSFFKIYTYAGIGVLLIILILFIVFFKRISASIGRAINN